MTRRTLSRRDLLRGVGGVAIALPWLEAMGCSSAPDAPSPDADAGAVDAGSADAGRDAAMRDADRRDAAADAARADVVRVQEGRGPRRLLVVTVPDGTLPDRWFPTGGETDFALGPILAPLAAHRDDLIIFRGLDNKVTPLGHFEGMCSMLTGVRQVGAREQEFLGGGVSVDQRIAQAIVARPGAPRFGSLVLGTNGATSGVGVVSYRGAGDALPKVTSGARLFEQLFPADAREAAQRRARQQSLLDSARADYDRLRAVLGAADRAALAGYLDSIRELERQLAATAASPLACDPGAPAFVPSRGDGPSLPEITRDLFDTLVLALRCDLTRVASFVTRSEGATSSYTFGWLGIGPSGDPYAVDPTDDANSTSHHSMSHNDTTERNVDYLTRVGQYFTGQLAYLIQKLKDTPDGPGGQSLFDNTTILYASPIARGAHDTANLPWLLAGGCGGAFRTGRYLQYEHASHLDLLVSLQQAMGVASNTFGMPEFCTGPLAGLAG
jgi:hypothetical protein